MTSYLPLSLHRFDTEELLWKINSSLLTFNAHQAALKLLSERGVDTQSLPKEPSEFTEGVPYGLRSAEERMLSLNTLLNFLLLILLPLTIAGLYYSVPEAVGWSSWLVNGLSFLVFFWILRTPYNQVFNRPDRLGFGLKIASYVAAMGLSAYYFADWLVEPWRLYGTCILWGW